MLRQCYQHQDGSLGNGALLRKARCASADPISHQVSVSLLQDPKGQHTPSVLPPAFQVALGYILSSAISRELQVL